MSLNFFEHKPYGKIDTSIGSLTVFYISSGDQQKLRQDLAKPFEKPDSKPSDPILTHESVKPLSPGDVEAFAKLYVESNEYLFRKWDTKYITGADGKQTQTTDLGDIIHPKKADETFTQYLQRLSVIEEKSAIEMGREFAKSLGVGAFSPDLSKRISATLGMGNLLKQFTDSLQTKINIPQFRPVEMPLTRASDLTQTILDTQRLQREAALAPFKELNQRLDKLVEISAQSSSYMVAENVTQTQIAAEIKKSGNDATRYAKWILFFTLVGVVVSVYVVVKDNHDSEARERQITNAVSSMTQNFSNMVNAVHDLQASQQLQNSSIVSAVQNPANSAELLQLIKLQTAELQKLSSVLAAHSSTTNADPAKAP
jgi:hypothetical protein